MSLCFAITKISIKVLFALMRTFEMNISQSALCLFVQSEGSKKCFRFKKIFTNFVDPSRHLLNTSLPACQCDQTARLFVQYLAISNSEKVDPKICQSQNQPIKDCTIDLKFIQSSKISPNLVTLHAYLPACLSICPPAKIFVVKKVFDCPINYSHLRKDVKLKLQRKIFRLRLKLA